MKRTKKAKVNVLHKLLVFPLLMTIIIHPTTQKTVFFSTKQLLIRTTREISDHLITEHEPDLLQAQILSNFQNNELKQKGKAMWLHIDNQQKAWREQTYFLIEERIDRSLDFLGSFCREVSGSPGARQYDQQQTQLKELYHLSKNEAHQIKDLKKRIKLSNAELKTLIGLARAERDRITNEINKELYITQISAHLDVLNLGAQTIIDIANKENAQINNTVDKAIQKLPSKHLFFPDTIREIIESTTSYDKLTTHLFATNQEVRDLYTIQCTQTA